MVVIRDLINELSDLRIMNEYDTMDKYGSLLFSVGATLPKIFGIIIYITILLII